MCAFCEVDNYYDEDNDEWQALTREGSSTVFMGLADNKIGIWSMDGYGFETDVFYPTYCPICGRKIIENE